MNSFQLEKEATRLLEAYADGECCRECGLEGQEAGTLELVVYDGQGRDTYLRALAVIYACPSGHRWHKGEGKKRGIEGVLFERQLRNRRRHECYELLEAIGLEQPADRA